MGSQILSMFALLLGRASVTQPDQCRAVSMQPYGHVLCSTGVDMTGSSSWRDHARARIRLTRPSHWGFMTY